MRVVIAGAGLAGLRTAAELRERGFTGQITLIGAEALPPYDRPPLSKKVLTDEGIDPSLRADFGALGVDFRPGEAATGLDAEALATTRDKYPYDRLILATGALPVALPGPGRQRLRPDQGDRAGEAALAQLGGGAQPGQARACHHDSPAIGHSAPRYAGQRDHMITAATYVKQP